MPDEQTNDSQIEAEMLRLMAQEAGGEAPSASAEADAEAAMLQMLQGAEQSSDAEGVTGEASQKALNGILEAEVGKAVQERETASPPPRPLSIAASSAFSAALDIPQENVTRLLDVYFRVSIELGRVEIKIQDILGWAEGSLIQLDKIAGDPVDVLINGKRFARGEVVVIAENFGVRITEMFGGG